MSIDDLRNKVCCINLLNAILDSCLDEVVSGLYFPNKGKGISRIKFCPFCAKEIETIKLDSGWDWKIKTI